MINRQSSWYELGQRQKRLLKDGTIDGSFKGQVRLNRSRKWQPATTYQEARDASPSHRPVR